LNVFKLEELTRKGAETREVILDRALQLFRQHGFSRTTMRDVAKAANLAVGAAYYYFPGKDAIVQAFYERVQHEHRARVSDILRTGRPDLAGRLRSTLHAKLDIVQEQRGLLAAVLRFVVDPEHPLSPFASATRDIRRDSIAVFAMAFDGESLPRDLAEILPEAVWMLHLLVLLFFVHDRSAQQRRTRKLVDTMVDLLVAAIRLARLPVVAPIRRRLVAAFHDVRLTEAHA
jgi:AcrR family transcriptional regulator